MIQLTKKLESQWKYFGVVYGLAGLSIFFFILRYNIQFNLTDYNSALLGIFLVFLISPLSYFLTKSYEITAFAMVTLGALDLMVLLFAAGANKAPGLFWVTAFPMVLGILLKKRGIILGVMMSSSFLVGFSVLERLMTVPNFLSDPHLSEQAKLLNTWLFLCFLLSVTYFFINNEGKMQKKISDEKEKADNLLRLLLHDIATPLMVIQTHNNWLATQSKDPEVVKTVDVIGRNASNMIELLQQVREMRATSEGKIAVDLQEVALARILKETIGLVEPVATEKEVAINCENLLSASILGDESILKNIIFSNILSNAIKFSNRGEKIDVRSFLQNKKAVVEVRDYGIGMPAELLNSIFDLKKMTTRKGTQGEKGTGYGMILVNEWVKRLGGEIEIKSQEKDSDSFRRGTLVRLSFAIS